MNEALLNKHMESIKSKVMESIRLADELSTKLRESLIEALSNSEDLEKTLWRIGRALSEYDEGSRRVASRELTAIISDVRSRIVMEREG